METGTKEKQQAGQSLQKLSHHSVIEKDSGMYVSVYSGDLTQKELAKGMARLKVAFPQLPKDFFFLLGERMKEKRFSDKRMIDAINHVIDTCKYPTPTIAEFLNYDKLVKLYTYNEASTMVTEGKAAFDDFEIREIDGEAYRVLKNK